MLTEWKTLQEEAAKRDHRVIGRQQALFNFNEVSPGSAFWLPHGARIFNRIIDFQRKQYRKRGFEEVISPNIYSCKLWMVSGHWEKYEDSMFRTVCEKEEYGLKPMNCPGHCILFASQPHSYKELPIRFADFGVLHRNELSGALTGLTRVRRFQQDDAHIFCRLDQVADEIVSALRFLKDVYDVLGFKFYLCHSTRPANKLGTEEVWDTAEAQLRIALNGFCGIPEKLPDPFGKDGDEFSFDGRPDALKKLKALARKNANSEDPNVWKGPSHPLGWFENTGDGAFYGPKIDIQVEDALGRRHQCGTIQLDFNLPQRFGLKYTLPTAEKTEQEKEQQAPKEKKEKNAAAPAAAAAPAKDAPKVLSYETAVKDLGIDLELDPNQARPVMIHRAIFGSMERCIAILCEHYGGEWPFWMSPRQVMIVPVSNALADYANEVRDHLYGEGFFVDVDLGSATLDKKIRNAELARYNFIFVVGQQELDSRSVNVRARGEKRIGNKSLDEATQWLNGLANSCSKEY
ncbi:threonyl-tRNA synthetase [Angomonas deanei]|nr:threonyl-tRNA synthetase [Angomonas deanei]|eukprot:EPY39861.1 threonyl-tRNA synthetase [Angomonas deanei]